MSETKDNTETVSNYSGVSVNTEPVIMPQLNPVNMPSRKGPYDIKTHEDLLEALEESRIDIKEGRVISHEVMMEKLKRYAEEE